MGFFDWLFKNKEEKKVDDEVPKEELAPNEEMVQVDHAKNVIRTKCACGHKKAKKTSDGLIKCRRCKSVIGRAV